MAKPFLRWAGGKRWLAMRIGSVLKARKFDRYIEPFIGGGSVFFEIEPNRSIISDINEDLISTYEQVASDADNLVHQLATMPVNEKEYYEIRSSKPKSKLERAARFIYLNRCCYNGLHRVNKSGDFNVPYGQGRNHSNLIKSGGIQHASRVLKNTCLLHSGFESALKRAKPGDLVYCDPVYASSKRDGKFNRYCKDYFCYEKHTSLRDTLMSLYQNDVDVVLSIQFDETALSLYHPFRPVILSRFSSISGSRKRSHFTEALYVLTKDRNFRTDIFKSLNDISID